MKNPKDIVRDGYDLVSRAYRGDAFDTKGTQIYDQCVDTLLEHLSGGSWVLDLGCGCGVPATQSISFNHSVTGVDFSPVQIERARSLVPSGHFICADMTAVDFPPDKFDAIISLYAIIHIPIEEQQSLFQKIATWLKPDGWLLCTVGHREWTGTEENWLGVAGGTMFWSHADENTYKLWLKELGFEIVESIFIPEGKTGHVAFLARRVANKELEATGKLV